MAHTELDQTTHTSQGDDPGDTASILAYLISSYPNLKELSQATLANYIEQLEHHEPKALLAAARLHVATSTFFPAIAELNKAVASLSEFADDAPSLEKAWVLALKYARSLYDARTYDYIDGEPAKPMQVHSRVKRAVQVIDGDRLLANENPTALFAQFRETYKNLTAQDAAPALPPAVQAYVNQVTAANAERLKELPAPAAEEKQPARALHQIDAAAISEELKRASDDDAQATRRWLDQVNGRMPPLLNEATANDPEYQRLLQVAAQGAPSKYTRKPAKKTP